MTLAPVVPTRRPPCRARRGPAALWLVLAPALVGCATYPERTASALADYRAGRLERAADGFAERASKNPFLAGAEAGMVRLTAGDWAGARDDLTRASEAAREAEERALLSATEGVETLGTLLVNDTAASYTGEGYERVLVHAALAIAYLGLGDFAGMRVETRRANQVLEAEEELYDSDYGAGGLGHLLSAIGYEMERRLDEALIDYRRMVEKGVGLELAGPRLRELADRFEREDLRELVAPFEPTASDGSVATVWVLAGSGLAPFKQEAQITLPTGAGLVRLTAPVYASRAPASRLTLELPDGGARVPCVLVEDVDRVARANLDDRIALAALRTGARALIRAGVRDVVQDEHGDLAAVAVDVLSLVLERADLRSWLTLPREWQAARVTLPPGVHTLEVSSDRGHRTRLGRFELEAGETMLVFARCVEGSLFAHPIGGLRVDDHPTDPPAGEGAAQTPTTEP